jgi:hypothetical protein
MEFKLGSSAKKLLKVHSAKNIAENTTKVIFALNLTKRKINIKGEISVNKLTK